MAKVLTNYEWPASPETGRPPQYPWKKWADGEVRRLTHGVDFDCTIPGFKSNASTVCRRRGWQLRIAVEDSRHLVIQITQS